MSEFREHAGRTYAVDVMYAVPDDAWHLELSEMSVPPEGTGGSTRLAGEVFMSAVVPDEDPGREPMVTVGGSAAVVPYEIIRWFMDITAAEVERSREFMATLRLPATG